MAKWSNPTPTPWPCAQHQLWHGNNGNLELTSVDSCYKDPCHIFEQMLWSVKPNQMSERM